MLQMRNEVVSVLIHAEAGGGIAGFDWYGRHKPMALMRRYNPTTELTGGRIDPRQLSCFPLLPWSNRITNGGFMLDGRWIGLSLNCEDERWPIHGSGWQSSWQVELHTASEVCLSLQKHMAASYQYDAALHYSLSDETLRVDMEVTNIGPTPMPFGLGLHPFFPRRGSVHLLAPATKVWINDGQTPLPRKCVAVPIEWDFRTERVLPRQGLDNAFQAWTGEATIHWPLAHLGLRISTNVDGFVLYTPTNSDFFCFEPVDHPINAVNLPGGAVENGMTLLPPQAVLRRKFAFSVLDTLKS